MKPLRIFRATGDCGCGTNPYSQTLSNSGACADPAAGAEALICDPKYYNLGSIVKVRMLGVALGGNCQQYLKPSVAGRRGFVFMDTDGQVYVEHEPKLTLPFHNPAVDGVYPTPAGFPYLQIGVGPDPIVWKHLVAPSVGELALVSINGQFLLRDVTSGSGNTAVCSSGATIDKVSLFGCIDTGELDDDDNPIYALRKLTVTHNRVLVGDIDGLGVTGYKQLEDTDHLLHPLAVFPDLKAGTYQQTTAADPDNPSLLETGGMLVNDPATDNTVVLCGYSPTTNKFSRLAARTKEMLDVNADVAVADSGAYVEMGTHCKLENKVFNYPDFFISAMIRVANDAPDNFDGIDFGLFIDGVQVHTWDVKGKPDATLSLLYEGISIGTHTVAIRFRQTSAPGNSTIKYSNTSLFTVL
jgi:hypothetical protein